MKKEKDLRKGERRGEEEEEGRRGYDHRERKREARREEKRYLIQDTNVAGLLHIGRRESLVVVRSRGRSGGETNGGRILILESDRDLNFGGIRGGFHSEEVATSKTTRSEGELLLLVVIDSDTTRVAETRRVSGETSDASAIDIDSGGATSAANGDNSVAAKELVGRDIDVNLFVDAVRGGEELRGGAIGKSEGLRVVRAHLVVESH